MSKVPKTSDQNETGKSEEDIQTSEDLDRSKKKAEQQESEQTRRKTSHENEKLAAPKKATAVNFVDTCQLYEIDLESGKRKKELPKPKPPALKSLRYYVMLLALISPFVTTYSRTIINFAITDMIDPEFVEKKASAQQEAGNATDQQYFDRDNSCPVSEEVRAKLIADNNQDLKRARSGSGEKYPWDTAKQGFLKGAFAIGHALFQIPGSRLSEMYGSRSVLSASSLLIGICCLSAPYLAAVDFYLLFIDLFILGIVGSFMTPALMTLFSNWLTPSEKSLIMSLYLVTSRLGYALSSLLCGLLIEAQYSWRNVFFSAGWIGLPYSVVFFLLARSTPAEHWLSSKLELNYLASKNTLVRESLEDNNSGIAKKGQVELKSVGEQKQAQELATSKKTNKKNAPWMAIATNVPVWAFIITKFCVKLAGDTVQIELPSYLKNVMHFSAKDNGIFNAWNYVIFCGSCLIVGLLSKYIVKERPFGLEKKAIRKCFQCFASFNVSLALLGIAYSVCNHTYTQIWMFMLFITTSFSIGGEAQVPFDITERYPGTIHAIGSSLAISGFIEPILVGFVIRGHAADQSVWKGVWLGASVVSLIGGLVFLLFADATIQPFDSIEKECSVEKPVEIILEGSDNKAYVKEIQAVCLDEEKVTKDDGKPYRESRQI